MAEYIEREAAKHVLEKAGAPAYAIHALDLVKTSNVAPVVQGRWLDTGCYGESKNPIFVCSECRRGVEDYFIKNHKFCLHCGARMEEV